MVFMKKFYIAFLFVLSGYLVSAQPINYTFTPLAGTYTALAAPTAISEIFWGADDELSAAYPIGFNFKFGNITYTQFELSSNGWITFNLYPFISNNPNSDAVNDLSGDAIMRPGIAPLWDDLAFNNNTAPTPQAGYQLTGVAPNRILTIQWTAANWKILGTAPGELSFQVKLYETLNRIDMVYHVLGGTLNAPSASIGLAGPTLGDYYSLNNTGVAPTASKVVNTQTLAAKPAEGQIYRWDNNVGLPITLLTFNAVRSQNVVLLNWSTATETNNKEFTIERTTDKENWMTVATVKGAGNSSKVLYYNATDENPADGISYYRLKQTDYDGAFTYSAVVAVEGDPLIPALYMSPNPATNRATLNFQSATAGNATVTIHDCTGREISTITISTTEGLNTYLLDVSKYSNGVYFITLNNTLQIFNAKCVVNHL